MNSKEKDEVVNYTLGVSGLSTVSALFSSMRQSKLLTSLVIVGLVAMGGFFYYLLS